jgi:hypothetical protein
LFVVDDGGRIVASAGIERHGTSACLHATVRQCLTRA